MSIQQINSDIFNHVMEVYNKVSTENLYYTKSMLMVHLLNIDKNDFIFKFKKLSNDFVDILITAILEMDSTKTKEIDNLSIYKETHHFIGVISIYYDVYISKNLNEMIDEIKYINENSITLK